MSRGRVYPAESRSFEDSATGARIRQVTDQASIHHHPFFFVPAYDDAHGAADFHLPSQRRARRFSPRSAHSGRLVQLTERAASASIRSTPRMTGAMCISPPAPAATACIPRRSAKSNWSISARFGCAKAAWSPMPWARPRSASTIAIGRCASASGAAPISPSSIPKAANAEIILQRDTIAHLMFCPDDSACSITRVR